MLRHLPILFAAVSQVHYRAYDFRDHVPGFAQHHSVSDFHAFPAHLERIMEGSSLHIRAIYQHFFHYPVGGYSTGAPDPNPDIH